MIDQYFKTKNTTGNKFGSEHPQKYKPSPTQRDYQRGFIKRYFAQKKNKTNQITEINRSQYLSHPNMLTGLNARLYRVFEIDWKISGVRNDIYNGKVPVEIGVEDTNKNIIEIAERQYTGISDYLDDPLEFWEGRDNE